MALQGLRFKILKDGSNGALNFWCVVEQVSRLTQKEVMVIDSGEHVVFLVGGSFTADVGVLALGGISIELV